MYKKLFFLLFVFYVTYLPAYAQVACTTCTCASLGSGSWFSPSTWSCGRVPTSSDRVCIGTGHTVSATGTTSFLVNIVVASLCVNGGTLSLSGQGVYFAVLGPTVNNPINATFVTTNQGSLNLQNGARFRGMGDWFLFNNGNISAVTGSSSFFGLDGCAFTGNQNCNINANQVFSGTLSFCLQCLNSQTRCNGNVTPPQAISPTGICSNILAVNFVDFSGKYLSQGNKIYRELRWQIASESAKPVGSTTFIVERSTDGKSFKEIVRLTNVGNSFYYLDDFEYRQLLFYRIKAIELDGTVNYSKIISFNPLDTDKEHCSNFDVLLKGDVLTVAIGDDLLNQETTLKVVVLDMLGNIVHEGAFIPNQQVTSMKVANNLQQGLYIVYLNCYDGNFYQKLFVE